MHSVDGQLPHARDGGLLHRPLPDGLMVYDLDRDEAHSLNRTAALVWQHCDGRTSVPELAACLQRELNLPGDEDVVRLALDQLAKARLLRETPALSAETSRTSRRAVIRKLGMAGGLAALLPLVDSIAAPKAAYAESPTKKSGNLPVAGQTQTPG